MQFGDCRINIGIEHILREHERCGECKADAYQNVDQRVLAGLPAVSACALTNAKYAAIRTAAQHRTRTRQFKNVDAAGLTGNSSSVNVKADSVLFMSALYAIFGRRRQTNASTMVGKVRVDSEKQAQSRRTASIREAVTHRSPPQPWRNSEQGRMSWKLLKQGCRRMLRECLRRRKCPPTQALR